MKKIIKYLLVLIFIVPAAFMFFACGETDNGGGNNPGGGTPSNLGTLYGIYVQYGDEEKSQNYYFSTNFEYGEDISEVYNYKIIANYRKNPNLEIDKNNPDLTIEYFVKSYSDGGEVRTPIQTIPETPDVGSYLIVITFGQQTAEISFYVEQNPSVDPNYTFVVKSAGETEDNTYAYNTEDNVVISVKDANNQNISNDNFSSVYYLTEAQYEEYSQCEDTFVAKQEYLSNLMSGNNIDNWVSTDENGRIMTGSLDVGTYYFFTYVYSMGNYSTCYTNPVRVVVKKGTIIVSTVGNFELKGEFDVWNNYDSENWDSETLTLADVTISTIDYTQDDNPGLYFGDAPLSYFGNYVFSSPETKIKGIGNNLQSVDFVLNEEYQNNYNTLPSIQIPVVINKYAISRPCVYGTYEDIDYETTYNGSEINFTEQLQYYSNTLSSITNATKTNAGTYTSVISIKEPEFFEWDNRYLSEGYNYGEFNTTNNTASFVWKINKAYQTGFRVKVKNASGEFNDNSNYSGGETAWYNNNGGIDIEIVYDDENIIRPATTNWYWAFLHDDSISTGNGTLLHSETQNSRLNKINVTECGSLCVYLANTGDSNFEPFGDIENITEDSTIAFQFGVVKAELPNATEIQAQLNSYPATVQLSADNNDQFTVPASMFPTNSYSSQGTWVLKNTYGDVKNVGDSVNSYSSAGDTFSWTLSFVPTLSDIYNVLDKVFILELIHKDLPVANDISADLEVLTQTTHKLLYHLYSGDNYTLKVPESVVPTTDYSEYGDWRLYDQNGINWSINSESYDYQRVVVTGPGEWTLKFEPQNGGIYRGFEVTLNVIVQVPFTEDVSDDLECYEGEQSGYNYEYTLKIVNNKITIPAGLIPTNTHTDLGEWKLFNEDGNEVQAGDELTRTAVAYEYGWYFLFVPTDTNYAENKYFFKLIIQSDLPVPVANDLNNLWNGTEYTYSLTIENDVITIPTALFPNNTYYAYGHWELYDNNGEIVLFANSQQTRTAPGHENWTYKFIPNNELYDTFEATIDIVIQIRYNVNIVIDDLNSYKNDYDNYIYYIYLDNNSNTVTIPAALIPQTSHTTEGHWELYDGDGNKREAGDVITVNSTGSFEWTFRFVPTNELYAEAEVIVYVGFYYTIPNSYYTDINAVINDETARTIQLQGTDEIEVPYIVPSTVYTEGAWTLYTDKDVKVTGGRGLSGYAEGEYTWKYVFEFNTTGNYNLTHYAEPVEITIIVVENN